MKKIPLFALLFVALPVSATNHYVRAGAAGTASGADWTNAYTALPASLVRGDLYYISKGNYASHNFNDADSGATTIEVRAATIADHGTATGWMDSYQGQAVFANDINFGADYYIFNGAYRSTVTGNPKVDWSLDSGYGFQVDNHTARICNGNVMMEIGANAPTFQHDITVEYTDLWGSGVSAAVGGNPCEDGLDVVGGSYIKFTLGAIHSVGEDISEWHGNHGHIGGGGGYGTGSGNEMSYTWASNNCCNDGVIHGQGLSVSEDEINWTLKYNYLVNMVSTSTLFPATPCDYNTCSGHNGPWYIYGNVFYGDTSNHCAAGDGVLALFDVAFSGTVYVLNNTFSFLSNANCSNPEPAWFFNNGDPSWRINMAGFIWENNLIYKGDNENIYLTCPTLRMTCTGAFTWDYNSWLSMLDTSANSDTSTHVQRTPLNPFQADTSYDFRLTSHTAAGLDTTSILAANGTDMLGATRGTGGTWDRGAFQLSGAAPPPPVLHPPVLLGDFPNCVGEDCSNLFIIIITDNEAR
jgi:hypothetical protein